MDQYVHDLLIENTKVNRVKTHANTDWVRIRNSTIRNASLDGTLITIEKSSIEKLMAQATNLFIEDSEISSIEPLHPDGLSHKYKIRSSVIKNCKENAFKLASMIFIQDSIIENASTNCFNLIGSSAVFQNVTFNNFKNDSLIYGPFAQISFVNVTLNGVRNLTALEQFHLVFTEQLTSSNLVFSDEVERKIFNNVQTSNLQQEDIPKASQISMEREYSAAAIVIPVILTLVVLVIGVCAFLVFKR